MTTDGRRHPGIFKQVDRLVAASEAEAELGFMARLMTLCSLPRSNPGKKREYVRRNGPYTLTMFAGADLGLPYGTLPRLMMSWVSSEAVRTQSREIVLGNSLADFMRLLGLYSGSGRMHVRLKNQIRRLFQSHVQLSCHGEDGGGRFVNAVIADKGEFWWSESKPNTRSLWPSKILLSEQFFNEVIRNPVPLDTNILKALKRSPLGLDLYVWLVYRTFSLDAPMRLSWAMLYRQFGADPEKAGDKRTVDNFRTDCLRELKKIKTAWPGLEYCIERGSRGEKGGALVLLPSVPAIQARTAP